MSDYNSSSNKNSRNGVAFFPTLESLAGNPYWPILAEELQKKGVFFDKKSPYAFDLKWLIENRGRIKILNLHFIQQFYKSSTTLRMSIKLIRFGFLMLTARLFGYRIIFTLHNLVPTYEVSPTWVDRIGYLIAVHLSNRIIVYCKEAKHLMKDTYGRKSRVYYVDHPNLIEYYQNAITKTEARNQLNLSLDGFVFTFIGGVRPNKGVEILIEAFKQLENKDYRLLIAGNIYPPESYAKSLIKMAENDGRISFDLKFIPEDEMQIYLNASDIIVLPFAKILTSGTANLAMSFGRPVIVPRIGCLPELIEPGLGWLFEQDNPASLAEVMDKAAQCEVEKVGDKAFHKLSKCTPERFAEQTLNAYFD
jgi:glycosyltransferase involved in cell wall biosynthesis